MDFLYKFENPMFTLGSGKQVAVHGRTGSASLDSASKKEEKDGKIQEQKKEQKQDDDLAAGATRTAVGGAVVLRPAIVGKQNLVAVAKPPMLVVAAPPPSKDLGIFTTGLVKRSIVETFGSSPLKRSSKAMENLSSLSEDQVVDFPTSSYFKENGHTFQDQEIEIEEFDDFKYPFPFICPLETIYEVDEENYEDDE